MYDFEDFLSQKNILSFCKSYNVSSLYPVFKGVAYFIIYLKFNQQVLNIY